MEGKICFAYPLLGKGGGGGGGGLTPILNRRWDVRREFWIRPLTGDQFGRGSRFSAPKRNQKCYKYNLLFPISSLASLTETLWLKILAHCSEHHKRDQTSVNYTPKRDDELPRTFNMGSPRSLSLVRPQHKSILKIIASIFSLPSPVTLWEDSF